MLSKWSWQYQTALEEGYLILTYMDMCATRGSRRPNGTQNGHALSSPLSPPLSSLTCSVSMPERRAQSSTPFRADHHLLLLHHSQSAPCTRILQCLSIQAARASLTTQEQVTGEQLHPPPLAPVPPLASAGTCPSQCYAVHHNHLYRLCCLTVVFSRYQPARG
jgi:hypothetical protein